MGPGVHRPMLHRPPPWVQTLPLTWAHMTPAAGLSWVCKRLAWFGSQGRVTGYVTHLGLCSAYLQGVNPSRSKLLLNNNRELLLSPQ